MAGYYPSNCDLNIPPHTCDPCETTEYGVLRSAGFIHKDFAFTDGDTENVADWQQGILDEQILVIPATNGEMPAPSEILKQGYGDTAEILIGFDFTANFNDPNFASNCDFYNALVGNRNFKFFYRTQNKTYITDVPVTIIPKYAIQNDYNSVVEWNVGLKWKSKNHPCPFDTPEGIFQCFELEEGA